MARLDPIKPPETVHEETYRDVQYRINKLAADGTIYGIFMGDGFRRVIGLGVASSRYFTDDEIEAVPTPEIMRRAIDRMHSRAPCFTGDLRYRFERPQLGR